MANLDIVDLAKQGKRDMVERDGRRCTDPAIVIDYEGDMVTARYNTYLLTKVYGFSTSNPFYEWTLVATYSARYPLASIESAWDLLERMGFETWTTEVEDNYSPVLEPLPARVLPESTFPTIIDCSEENQHGNQ